MARLNVCIGAIAISSAAIADIVTNDVMSDVTVSTVLSGVTNIISTTRDVNISADLTLTDRSFVWLQGAGGVGYVNIAPTARRKPQTSASAYTEHWLSPPTALP